MILTISTNLIAKLSLICQVHACSKKDLVPESDLCLRATSQDKKVKHLLMLSLEEMRNKKIIIIIIHIIIVLQKRVYLQTKPDCPIIEHIEIYNIY